MVTRRKPWCFEFRRWGHTHECATRMWAQCTDTPRSSTAHERAFGDALFATSAVPITLRKVLDSVARHVNLNFASVAEDNLILRMPPIWRLMAADVTHIVILERRPPQPRNMLGRRRWHLPTWSSLMRRVFKLTRFHGLSIRCLAVLHHMQLTRQCVSFCLHLRVFLSHLLGVCHGSISGALFTDGKLIRARRRRRRHRPLW